jgi:hypothetical protein
MEHPLVNDIDNLTAEELQSKISYLLNKYNWAVRNNAHLASQVLMVLHSYQAKYQEKLRKDTDNNFDDVIDIS